MNGTRIRPDNEAGLLHETIVTHPVPVIAGQNDDGILIEAAFPSFSNIRPTLSSIKAIIP